MLFSFYTSAHHVGRGDSVFGLCLLPHRRSVRLSVTKETRYAIYQHLTETLQWNLHVFIMYR